MWFWNSWSEFFNTALKTEEDKFKDISTQFTKHCLEREKKSMNMEVQKVLNHHFKNGLGREPTLETLTWSKHQHDHQKTIQRHLSQNCEKMKLYCQRSLKYLI